MDHEITFKGVLIGKALEEFSKAKKNIKLNVTEKQAETINQILDPKMEEDTQKNNFTEMRKTLFETMRKVEAKQLTPNEGASVASIAQVIINSVKVELEFKLKLSKSIDGITATSKALE